MIRISPLLVALPLVLASACSSTTKSASEASTPSTAQTAKSAAPVAKATSDKGAGESKSAKADAKEDSKSEAKEEKSSRSHLEMKCERGDEMRTILVVAKDEGGCEVQYVKAGNAKVVATSASSVTYCDQVQDRMKKKLEASEFSCQ